MLGVAAWLKLLPFLGVVLLVWQRKFKAAAIAVLVAVALDVILSVGAYGVGGAWSEHIQWWKQGAAGTTHRQLTSVRSTDEDRPTNQSVAVTLRRLLSTLGRDGTARDRVSLMHLTGPQLQAVYSAVNAALLFGLAVYCWPGAAGPLARKMPAIVAMIVLATVWFSPVVWSYHFSAATPALAILVDRCHKRNWLLTLLIVGWLASLGLLAFSLPRVLGVLLWTSLAVGAALAWLAPRDFQTSTAER